MGKKRERWVIRWHDDPRGSVVGYFQGTRPDGYPLWSTQRAAVRFTSLAKAVASIARPSKRWGWTIASLIFVRLVPKRKVAKR